MPHKRRYPGHKLVLDTSVYRATDASCTCGWQGPIRGSQALARGDYSNHLDEVEQKRQEALRRVQPIAR